MANFSGLATVTGGDGLTPAVACVVNSTAPTDGLHTIPQTIGENGQTVWVEDIVGLSGSGSDTLQAGSGIDWLFGGNGPATLSGGSGSAYIDGGAGTVSLSGGSGQDIIHGGTGSGDSIFGGSNSKTVLYGDACNSSTLYAGAFGQTLYGGTGTTNKLYAYAPSTSYTTTTSGNGNLIYGGTGPYGGSAPLAPGQNTANGTADTLYGNLGFDTLWAGSGNDLLIAAGVFGPNYLTNNNQPTSGSASLLHGGWGNDTLYGNGGRDTLWAGAGNSYLDGGGGLGTLYGGQGSDTFALSVNAAYSATPGYGGGLGGQIIQSHYGNFAQSDINTTLYPLGSATNTLLILGDQGPGHYQTPTNNDDTITLQETAPGNLPASQLLINYDYHAATLPGANNNGQVVLPWRRFDNRVAGIPADQGPGGRRQQLHLFRPRY